MRTVGWAIIDGNKNIDMKTVMDSKRGAIVNRLWNKGYNIVNEMSDTFIFALWENVKEEEEVTAVTVEIVR